MKAFKLIQILFLMLSLGACTKTKTRAKPVGTQGAKVSVNPAEQKLRAQNGAELPAVDPSGKAPPNSNEISKEKKDEPAASEVGASLTKPAPVLETRKADPPAENGKAKLPNSPAPVAAPAAAPVAAPAVAAKPAVAAAPAPASSGTISKAADSDAIKAEVKQVKISFKDLEGLKKIMSEKDVALHNGTARPQEQALLKLAEGNEDHFCRVKGLDKFNKDDVLKLVDAKMKEYDTENDINITNLVFENKNGKLEFGCAHTNSSLVLPDVRENFSKYLTLEDQKGATENENGYVNPHTATRLNGAFKISDVQALQKVEYSEKNDKGYALVNGKIVDGDEAITQVEEGKTTHACVLMDVKGKLTNDKVFGYARKPMMAKARENEKNIIVSYAFRADKEDGFMMYCHQPKTTGHDEIIKATKGIFKYGVLARKEFHKKTVELEKIRVEMQKLLEEKQKAAGAGANAGAASPSAGSVMSVIAPEKK